MVTNEQTIKRLKQEIHDLKEVQIQDKKYIDDLVAINHRRERRLDLYRSALARHISNGLLNASDYGGE